MWQSKAKTSLRIVGFLLGIALLAAAVFVAAGEVDFEQMRLAPWWLLAAIAVAVVANLALTAALFWVVTLNFDATPPVRLGRMMLLICASSLLNYLPLRAGLIGRAAYLKVRHDLPVRQSLVILLVVMTLGVAVLAAVALAVIFGPAGGEHWSLLIAIAALLAISPLVRFVARVSLGRAPIAAWSWLPLRIADMLTGALRLWFALLIFGSPLSFAQVAALSATGMLVALTGLTPNGLGLREWLISLVAGVFSPPAAAAALGASLVDRAVEAAVVAVLGMASVRRLYHKQVALPDCH